MKLGMRMSATVLTACLCASLLSGCGTIFREEFEEPKYDIRDQSVLLVQFREENLWYGESPDGADLSRALLFALQECDGVILLTDPTAEAMIYESLEDSPPWAQAAEASGADIIVFGAIRKLTFTQRDMIGMLSGKLQFTLGVYDANAGRVAFRFSDEVNYPKDPDTGHFEIALEQYRGSHRAALLSGAATRISALLCGEVVDYQGQ